MKAIFFPVILATFLTISCNKSNLLGGNSTPYNNTFSAVINGSSFTSTFTLANKNFLNTSNEFYLSGSNGTEIIQLLIYDFRLTTGTFTISPSGGGTAYGSYTPPGGGVSSTGTSGNITVTGVDKTSNSSGSIITGTFNFVTPNFNITMGNFSVLFKN